MLTFESVKSRLDREQPLSFLEFNYMLLQAYDFKHLNQNFGCDLQLGGSDQWGNILSGIELIRKSHNKKAYAITSPLITNNDGTKMGKTAEGAIWLNVEKLDNYNFYQFWRNINDSDVSKFLKLFTKLPLKEIDKISKLKDQEINEAKKILAYEVTKICRNETAAKEANDISENIFDKNINDDRIITLNVKVSNIEKNDFNLINALENLNLVKSRGEAKRLIKSKGIKVNNLTYEENNFSLEKFTNKKEIKIIVGKKKIGLIKLI